MYEKVVLKLAKNLIKYLDSSKDLPLIIDHLDVLLVGVRYEFLSLETINTTLESVKSVVDWFLIKNYYQDAVNYAGKAQQIAELYNLPDQEIVFSSLLNKSTLYLGGSNLFDLNTARKPSSPPQLDALITPVFAQTIKNIADVYLRSNDIENNRVIEQLNIIEGDFFYATILAFCLQSLRMENSINADQLQLVFGVVNKLVNALMRRNRGLLAWDVCKQITPYCKSLKQVDAAEFLRLTHEVSEHLSSGEAVLAKQSDWQRYQQQLYQYRAEFTQALADPETQINPQSQYTKAIRNFTAQLLQESEQLLGAAPGKYCMLALGSLSRGDMSPYSDLECLMLFDNPTCSYWDSNNNSFESLYFKNLYQLFEFKMASVGESKAGFRLDKQGHPRTEERLRGNIEHVLKFNSFPMAKLDDPMVYSLLSPSYIHGNENKELLLHYMREMKAHLSQPYPANSLIVMREGLAIANMQLHLQEFDHNKNLQKKIVNIKKDYLSFLNYWVIDLAYKQRLNFSGILDAVDQLSQRNIITPAFAISVKKAWQWLQALRIRVHTAHAEQYDQIALAGENNSSCKIILTEAETAKLISIRQGILVPCYKTTTQFLQAPNTIWPADPIASNLQQMMVAYQDLTKPMPQELIDEVIQSFLHNFIWRQASMLDYRHYYREFSSVLQKRMQFLIEQMPLALLPNKKFILTELLNYPRPDGRRPKDEAVHSAWQKYLAATLSGAVVADTTVKIAGFPKQQMNADLVRLGFNANGQLKGDRGLDGRLVNTIEYQEQRYQLQAASQSPGMEYAVERFYELVVGSGTPKKILAAAQLKSGGSYPFMISQDLYANSLSQVLTENQSRSLDLDAKNYSQMVIMAMLTNPESADANNYLVEKFVNAEGAIKSRLVSANNARSFVPATIKEITGAKLITKVVLYCFDMMTGVIHPEVREELLALSPHKVLLNWLIDLKKRSEEYQVLFPIQQQVELLAKTNDQEMVCILPLLSFDVVKHIYKKFCLLQAFLQHHKNITHLDLLKFLEPDSAPFYEKFLLQPVSPIDRFKQVAGKEYDEMFSGAGNSRNSFNKILQWTLNANLNDIQLEKKYRAPYLLDQIKLLQDQVNQLPAVTQSLLAGDNDLYKNIMLDELRQQAVNAIDFSRLNENQQENVLKVITGTNFSILNLSGCIALTELALDAILKASPNLIYLNINGCKNLSTNFIGTIHKNNLLIDTNSLQKDQALLKNSQSFFTDHPNKPAEEKMQETTKPTYLKFN